MIYSAELNEPTPEQLAEGVVHLQGYWWTEDEPDKKRITPYPPTVSELLEFIEKYNIPRSARIEYYECGSHTASLEWKE